MTSSMSASLFLRMGRRLVPALLGVAVCAAQKTPAKHGAAVDGLPPGLHHNRSAKNAAEQRAWDEAIFRYYTVPLTTVEKPASLKVRIDTRQKHQYRTRMRETAEIPANFADSVATDEIGCGTSCFSLGLVDLRTGASYLLPDLSSWNVFVRADRRRNSRALHVMGYVGRQPAGDRWYVWQAGTLKLVKFQPLSDDCFSPGVDPALWSAAACNFVADTDISDNNQAKTE